MTGTDDTQDIEVPLASQDKLDQLKASLYSDLVSFTDAAAVLNVSKYTVGRYVSAGKLAAVRIANQHFVPASSLEKLIYQLRLDAEQQRRRAAEKRKRPRRNVA